MNDYSENAMLTRMCELTVMASDCKKLRKTVLSKPTNKTLQKVVLTQKESSGKRFLQAEYFHKDNKVTHKNVYFDSSTVSALTELFREFMQIDLITTEGECEYKCSSSGKTVILGADKLQRLLKSGSDNTVEPASNNREKRYILDGSEPFLKRLGVSDANGRVYDKKQAKFRQINRFLELVRDIEDKLPEKDIYICDLCCGKSYLSFAVYHYFSNVKGYTVRMTGVDLKPDVIEHCNKVAAELAFDGLRFICQNVNEFTPSEHPSLVVSLHACDIATDFVLTRAAEWRTEVILSTPCCHHELNHNIDSPALSFITDYSMLRQKLCDAATDALRLCRLESLGYTTAALELIDPDETPKNIMLRAVRKKNFDPNSPSARASAERYIKAKEFLCGDVSGKDLHF